MLPNGSGNRGCYESRHLPGRLKVAPYEVLGRLTKRAQSRKGRLVRLKARMVREVQVLFRQTFSGLKPKETALP